MVRRVLTLALVTGALVVSGCNTLRGAERDAKSAGNAVEKAVD